jgi:hypothetical protein
MLETPHVALGAAIATKIPNPLISIPLALASHIILDRVPHWNPHFYTETQKYGRPRTDSTIFTLIDISLALALGSTIALNADSLPHTLTIFACCFASVLPDVTKAPYFFLGKRDGLLKKWVVFERSLQVDTNFTFGMINQALVIITCIFWIIS